MPAAVRYDAMRTAGQRKIASVVTAVRSMLRIASRHVRRALTKAPAQRSLVLGSVFGCPLAEDARVKEDAFVGIRTVQHRHVGDAARRKGRLRLLLDQRAVDDGGVHDLAPLLIKDPARRFDAAWSARW